MAAARFMSRASRPRPPRLSPSACCCRPTPRPLSRRRKALNWGSDASRLLRCARNDQNFDCHCEECSDEAISIGVSVGGRGKKRPEEEMTGLRHACAAAAVVFLGLASGPAGAQVMIVGNDEKITFDEAGKAVNHEPGKDTVSIVELSKPEAPRVAASIPLANTIVGPPTNLAIHPSGEFALVANSVNPQKEGDAWKNVPDDKVSVIDLKANPPKVLATVNAGKQPSGMAINSKGDLALVANRADGSVSVLSIKGKEVKVVDTVSVGAAADSVSGVAFTPDGKRGFAVKSAANKIALLAIDGEKVSYDKRDLPTGIFPYNIVVAPNGRIAIVVNNGAGCGSDGNVDTASVIDIAV